MTDLPSPARFGGSESITQRKCAKALTRYNLASEVLHGDVDKPNCRGLPRVPLSQPLSILAGVLFLI